MDTDSNKTIWTVIIVVAVAIMGGLFVKFVPNSTSQMQVYAQTVIGNFRYSGYVVDSSSNSDFIYSAPNTTDNTISIIGYKGKAANLIIPDYHRIGSDYYKVTAIGDSAFDYKAITSVVFSTSIKSIGRNAFYKDSISSVSFKGNDPVTLGIGTFKGNNLTKVTLPNGSKYDVDPWGVDNETFDSNVKVSGGIAVDD